MVNHKEYACITKGSLRSLDDYGKSQKICMHHERKSSFSLDDYGKSH